MTDISLYIYIRVKQFGIASIKNVHYTACVYMMDTKIILMAREMMWEKRIFENENINFGLGRYEFLVVLITRTSAASSLSVRKGRNILLRCVLSTYNLRKLARIRELKMRI